MKLTIGFMYPDLLNLYGDNGNVEVLTYRAKKRGIEVEIMPISTDTKLSSSKLNDINFIFMGGGPDSSQKDMYQDLVSNKGEFLRDYIDHGGVGLFICGAYQLLGHYYESADGSKLDGLGIFDLYTKHFGNHKPRCIGNLSFIMNDAITTDPIYKNASNIESSMIVGFENHGGRTYLNKGCTPLGHVKQGSGNNGEDKTEGIIYKNAFGSYSHGPLLSKNPHFSDYLLLKALKIDALADIDDALVKLAHESALKLK